jgi:uncharacterized protein YdiU (UPF0061 family)
MMKGKLGIIDSSSHNELIHSFLDFLEINKVDYTNIFIELMYPNSFKDAIYQSKEFQWLRKEIKKVGLDLNLMEKNNPQRILRNYFVEESLKHYEEINSLDSIKKLLKAVSIPYTKNDAFKRFQMPPSKDFDDNYKTHCNT